MITPEERYKMLKWLREAQSSGYADAVWVGKNVSKLDVVRWMLILVEENHALKDLVSEAWSFPPWPDGKTEQQSWVEDVVELDDKIRMMCGDKQTRSVRDGGRDV